MSELTRRNRLLGTSNGVEMRKECEAAGQAVNVFVTQDSTGTEHMMVTGYSQLMILFTFIS